MKLCECGCGRPAPIMERNNPQWGHVAGQPGRYIRGHNHKSDGRKAEDPNIRFDRLTKRLPNGCLQWMGHISRTGYGRFHVRRNVTACPHRFAWIRVNGPIPDDLVIDHLCRNRACVEPSHLEVVTQKENTHRGKAPTIVASLSGVCSKGHLLKQYQNQRGCPVCRVEYHREYRKRKRSA